MNMKKNNYVLIVRDKSSNSYSPIWYNIAEELCNENEVRIRLNSLEKIDSFTMNFGSPEELNEYLCTNCMTESRDSDIFIACRQHHKDKDEITFLEPIYNSYNCFRDKLRDIGKLSSNGGLKDASFGSFMFKELASKMYNNKEFFQYITYGNSCVNSDIYNKLLDTTMSELNYKNQIFSGSRWFLTNYKAIRNVVEAINRYNFYKANNRSIYMINKYKMDRKAIVPGLLEVTDPLYMPGQLSLFGDDFLKVYEKKNS